MFEPRSSCVAELLDLPPDLAWETLQCVNVHISVAVLERDDEVFQIAPTAGVVRIGAARGPWAKVPFSVMAASGEV